MTFPVTLPGAKTSEPGQRPLVLVGAGLPAELASRLAVVAPPLAALLDWPVRQLEGPPATALANLQAGGPALAWLPWDPGCWLEGQGTWAEALGAWRQPTLAVIPASQLAGGQAAALVALLRQERVPLLGLLQWQGGWQEAARRGDGLPWLGYWPAGGPAGGSEVSAEPFGSLGEEEDAALDALELVLTARWVELLAEL